MSPQTRAQSSPSPSGADGDVSPGLGALPVWIVIKTTTQPQPDPHPHPLLQQLHIPDPSHFNYYSGGNDRGSLSLELFKRRISVTSSFNCDSFIRGDSTGKRWSPQNYSPTACSFTNNTVNLNYTLTIDCGWASGANNILLLWHCETNFRLCVWVRGFLSW